MVFRKITEYKALLEEQPKQVQKNIISFVIYKQDDCGTLPQSMNTKISALRKFYYINYDEDDYEKIRWKKIREFVGEDRGKVEDKPYEYDQIHKLLAVCPRKLRICILAEAQGGVRIGAFHTMKVGDLTKNQEYGIYKVKVYPDTSSKYVTYFGPETTAEIDAYLDERKRAGEIITAESPLIRNDYDAHYKKDSVNPAKFISNRTINNAIYEYALKSGIRTAAHGDKIKRTQNMLTHGLRKFFKQQCRRSGIDPIIVEWLIGHRHGEAKIGINRLVMTYDPVIEEELLQNYLKAVDNLTINEETRLKRKTEEQQHTIKTQDEALQRAMEALNFLQEKANKNL